MLERPFPRVIGKASQWRSARILLSASPQGKAVRIRCRFQSYENGISRARFFPGVGKQGSGNREQGVEARKLFSGGEGSGYFLPIRRTRKPPIRWAIGPSGSTGAGESPETEFVTAPVACERVTSRTRRLQVRILHPRQRGLVQW
jgi:hypothetical protein